MEGMHKAALSEGVKRFVLRRVAPASLDFIPMVVSYSKKNMKRFFVCATFREPLVIISFLKGSKTRFWCFNALSNFSGHSVRV